VEESMKKRIVLLVLFFPLLSVLFVPWAASAEEKYEQPTAVKSEKFELPAAVKIELKRLEETYHVLDLTAEKVWPGWNNYRDFPFLFNFENGLSVLVGHPSPPEGFELLPDFEVADKKVYLDRRNISPLELEQPLSAGGGILPYGTTEDGKSISVVSIDLTRIHSDDDEKDKDNEKDKNMDQVAPPQFKTEDQILMYIHELFHCFQEDHVKIEHGNFRFNPDTEYAVYSEIEGLALNKAYHESNEAKAREYLKDFLMARELKRKGMTEDFQNEESSDEVREGTAVYSEVRTLEILKNEIAKGTFKAALTSEEDPYYGQFKEIDPLIENYVKKLEESSTQSYDTLMQRYNYGCFQALLLQRLFPGWQEPFSEEATFLDEEISKRIPISEKELAKAKKRFKNKKLYGIKKIKKRHQEAIDARDEAYDLITSREGMTYIISFKEISQFLSPIVEGKKQSYKMGLTYLYPQGIGTIKIDDIDIESQDAPAVIDQIYYLKFVDTEWEKRSRAYTLRFKKREGEDIYLNAVIITPIFVMKAPKVRVKKSGDRLKVWILSRVDTTVLSEKKDIETLVDWMTGTFTSEKQAEGDSDYFPIRLVMARIWEDRDDGYWLYVEQARMDNLDKPYRQRVYHIVEEQKGTFKSEVYTMPEPERFIGDYKKKAPLAELKPDSLDAREGCAVFLRRKGDSFVGGTKGGKCRSSLRGAYYATSEVTVMPDRMISWDRGFDSSGKQVWGSETGGYEFLRISGGEEKKP
jgi:hypothetical protein